MNILVTGTAGFIGFHVSMELLRRGYRVIGIDNLNDYYDVRLKRARLDQLSDHRHFSFFTADICDETTFQPLAQAGITQIVHLAAQAGVRHSLTAPRDYSRSNLVGQLEILEFARRLDRLDHLVYASSSSVYGASLVQPFSLDDRCDTPQSLYAATKRAGELMGYSYAHLYGLAMTGLRFFTVYGPYGRPDMAPFLFTSAILEGRPIRLFNNGDMERDFTYIDDIVSGILSALNTPPTGTPPHRLFNLGNHRAENLRRFVAVIEAACGRKAEIELAPMQSGDVRTTYADISETQTILNFSPTTTIDEGIPRFVSWYRSFYGI